MPIDLGIPIGCDADESNDLEGTVDRSVPLSLLLANGPPLLAGSGLTGDFIRERVTGVLPRRIVRLSESIGLADLTLLVT